jgi:hypothetical protein
MASGPYDYTRIIATANKLIKRFGRQVTLQQNGTVPAVAGKPWRESTKASRFKLEDVWAAIITWDDEDDKDSVRYGKKVALISATQIPGDDGEHYDTMVDSDNSTWHLHDCEVIQPGASRVLYIYVCER